MRHRTVLWISIGKIGELIHVEKCFASESEEDEWSIAVVNVK